MSRQELHPLTAVINKAQKNKSKHAKCQALQWLAATFPQVFNTSLSIQPLKIGILDDILAYQANSAEVKISKSKIREALRDFTRRVEYLTCLKAREMRVDLEGNPVEMVSEEEAKQAALKIKKRIEKSAKNARKALTSKPVEHKQTRSSTPKSSSSFSYPQMNATPQYGDRTVSAAPKKTPTITHKTNRSYDPLAVARLKERLGIARKEIVEEEV